MKLFYCIVDVSEVPVAPHRGAWIETGGDSLRQCGSRSHPTGVRGLKLYELLLPLGLLLVAPHRGAWIETH